ncbi:uncharacterized protein LOC143846677 isoform X2 [Tasmannia lanceolata]|uniref:uncharacterized protein LOC143846677 isoform X1 n=1 Tax=Tasmannia lanceolata TaxID=3420 RepID=UPI004063FDFD
MKWEKIELNNGLSETQGVKKSPGGKGEIFGPGKMWGHTCNSIRGGRFLYFFGGYGKDNCQTNDIHVYDTVKQIWSKPMVKGVPPSPRDSHSCVAVKNKLFVFGGSDGNTPLKDLHIFDASSNTWLVPSLSGEGPDAREGHSAVLVGKRIFIFGGSGKSDDDPEEVYFNDIFILDTESLVWKRAMTSGTPPSPRDSHTCSSWKNKIIVLGGEDEEDNYHPEVYILDADTLVWEELNTSGEVLGSRAGHCTVALGNHLFVFGGFTDERILYDDIHVLNVDTGNWKKVTTTGLGPSPRFSVAGDCSDLRKGILVFTGGCNDKLEALDDMYYLYTGISMGNWQDEQRPDKFSIRKALKRKCQEQYLLSANKSENDKDEPKCSMVSDSLRPVPLPSYGQAGDPKLTMESDLCRPVTLPSYGQAGKQNSPLHEFEPAEGKTFEATVTDAFHHGYSIETNIDGKPLHGILFSNNPSSDHDANVYVSRKSMGIERGSVKLDGGCDPKLKKSRAINQAQKDSNTQTNEIRGKESASMETLASDSNNSTPIDVCQPQMAPENSQPSPKLLDSEDDDLHNHKPEGAYKNSFSKSLKRGFLTPKKD